MHTCQIGYWFNP